MKKIIRLFDHILWYVLIKRIEHCPVKQMGVVSLFLLSFCVLFIKLASWIFLLY